MNRNERGEGYMDLSEQDLKEIKSLHVMLKMPIWILEERDKSGFEKLQINL